MTCRQNVIGKERSLAPGWGESDVQTDFAFVAQDLHPGESVRVGPHWVVYSSEVDIELAPSLFEEVGQEEAHLVAAEGIFAREREFVPKLLRWQGFPELGLVFVPSIRRGASRSANATGENVEQMQGPRYLPATQVT